MKNSPFRFFINRIILIIPVIIPPIAAGDEYGPDGGPGGHDLHHSLVAEQDIQSVIVDLLFISLICIF